MAPLYHISTFIRHTGSKNSKITDQKIINWLKNKNLIAELQKDSELTMIPICIKMSSASSKNSAEYAVPCST